MRTGTADTKNGENCAVHEEAFKVTFRISNSDCSSSKNTHGKTNPVSEILDDNEDDEDFESIIVGAVSNKTIRGILRKELHCGAFATFIRDLYYPGPQLEFLNHVMNIEACRRSVQSDDVIHDQFLNIYRYYEFKAERAIIEGNKIRQARREENAKEGGVTHPNRSYSHPQASVLIFRSLQKHLKATQLLAIPIADLSVLEMRKLMRKSQEEILGLLAVPLAEYILSPEYDPYNDLDDDAVARRRTEKTTPPPFSVHGEDGIQSNQFTAALEASVNKTLMARFREARLSHFNLNLISPSTTPPARLAEEVLSNSQSTLAV
jgi:hypothetical protein